MAPPIISVENLSKRYLVGHQREPGGVYSYTALRDVMGRELRNGLRKGLDVLRGRQVVQGDSVEEFWALKDVSFELQQGEILGIIGRNGAGKSTLLKVLSRITEPTAGRITLRGRVASLLEVGTGFHPELTGRENIYLNGAILGMARTEIRKKFDEIVAFAEVERFLDTPVKRYSSGMYVRLAFAVAAHLEPEILIIDEVLAVGDAEFQKKCLGKIDEASRREGRTVLFVSHNMAAVRSLCSTAILLEGGRISLSGAAAEVTELYVDTKQTRGQHWQRTFPFSSTKVSFETVRLSLNESVPHQLRCQLDLSVQRSCATSLLSIEIQDARGNSIIETVPSLSAFVPGKPGQYQITVDISLPLLIPGTYWVSFWLGPHGSETYDSLYGALSFDVLDSPTPGRTFPHNPEHGYVVAQSQYRLLECASEQTDE
jgi:lipopolysaccharide transport system ATP-binding protein